MGTLHKLHKIVLQGIFFNAVLVAAFLIAYYQNAVWLSSNHILGGYLPVAEAKATLPGLLALSRLFILMLTMQLFLWLWIKLGMVYIGYLKEWNGEE